MTKPLRGDAISKLNKLKLISHQLLAIRTSQRIGKLYKIMKQYFFLVTELVNGKLTPLKITLQSYNAIKFGSTIRFEVDKLNTCNMSVTSYTVTFK